MVVKLIRKLELYGLQPAIIEWITAFLLAQKQTVRINSALLDWQSVISGIPQGSVLGGCQSTRHTVNSSHPKIV